MSHLPQRTTAAAGAPYMEGSGTTGLEEGGKQGSMGSGAGGPAYMRAAGAVASTRMRIGHRVAQETC
jgi:hypothetical protein